MPAIRTGPMLDEIPGLEPSTRPVMVEGYPDKHEPPCDSQKPEGTLGP